MISGTESKAKFKKLQRRLGLSLWECTGLLESIWRVCVQNSPRGDIGRMSNEDIAAVIEWDRDADELIQALVDYGWLDECDEYRLVVHDWAKHAPNYIKGALAKHGQRMIGDDHDEQPAKQPARQPAKQDIEQPAKQDARAGATYPNLTKPIQTEPNRTDSGAQASGSSGEISISEEQEPTIRAETLSKLKSLREALGAGGRTRDDVLLVFQAVALTSLGELPESFLASAVESLELDAKRPRGDPKKVKNPMAYLRASLVRRCEEHKINFHNLVDRLVIPPWANESIDRIVAQVSHGGRQAAVGATQ